MAEDDSFVTRTPTDVPRTRGKTIKIRVDSEGIIDWDASSDSAASDLESALQTDESFRTAMADSVGKLSSEQSVVADTTVVALANAIMIPQAVAVSKLGPRAYPILRNLTIPVAMKAMSVTKEEMEPVMEPAKRVVSRWAPAQILSYQDEVILVEHLFKISGEKLKACIALAMQIEELKAKGQQQQRTNSHPVEEEHL